MRILYADHVSENVTRLRTLAQCIGIETELINVGGDRSFQTLFASVSQKTGIVLDIASLKYRTSGDELRKAIARISGSEVSLLLLVTDNDEATNRFVRDLTGGEICSVDRQHSVEKISFPVSGRALSGELSSQTYPRQSKDAVTLALTPGANTQVLMELGGSPAFVCLRSRQSRLFVWSTTRVFDVHQPLAAEMEFELASDEYIPAIIFLRATFGTQCWHNPVPGAGMVIDDPLLKPNYGFIDFRKLLESARKHQYHVTLAFIPWNYWRSRRKTTQLFREYSDCFDICAHGCDHTDSEFRQGTYEELLSRNFIASSRMATHALRIDIQSQPLMVCPKEQYSAEAMRAFADGRQFMALICTACMPRDLDQPAITGADLLLPAQDSFCGFPVFKRHYSNGMRTGVFAMALFLGKPAILVEHHQFFRGGPAGAEQFVRLIDEMQPALRWRSLEQTVMRTHARRQISHDRWAVRFFTDLFLFETVPGNGIEYKFMRRVPEPTRVESVRVAGKEIAFSRRDGFLAFETELREPGTVLVEVKVTSAKPTGSTSNGVKYHAAVALRRGLCEVRDNLIARNAAVLRASRTAMAFAKRKH